MPLRSDPSLWFNLPGVVAASGIGDLVRVGRFGQGAFERPSFAETLRKSSIRNTVVNYTTALLVGASDCEVNRAIT